jgi:hypothetical protein
MIELHNLDLWKEVWDLVKTKANAQGYVVKEKGTVWHIFKPATGGNGDLG